MPAIDSRAQARALALYTGGLDDAKRAQVQALRVAVAQLVADTDLGAAVQDAVLGLLAAHALTQPQRAALLSPLADTLAGVLLDAPGPALVAWPRQEVG